MTQLHCMPASLWSWNYGIETPQGIATVEFNFLKDEGEIALISVLVNHDAMASRRLLMINV